MPKLTAKQVGEAAEHLVASILNRQGFVVAKAPETTKGFDLFTFKSGSASTVQVKSRTYARNSNWCEIKDWNFETLSMVWYGSNDDIFPSGVWIIPKEVARELVREGKQKGNPTWHLHLIDLQKKRLDVSEKYRVH